MWSTEWGRAPSDESSVEFEGSRLALSDVQRAQTVVWEEHCIECAIPECYEYCPLYVRRRDGKCARLFYGIHRNPRFSGLFPFGADVRFRRWGKLEARLPAGSASPHRLRQAARIDRRILRVLDPLATSLERVDPKRKLNGAYALARASVLARLTGAGSLREPGPDEFVIEVTNPGERSVGLIIEADSGSLLFRTSLPIEPGLNLHSIPAGEMLGPFPDGEEPRRVLVYPENDAEARLIFTWLDFVWYSANGNRALRHPTGSDAPVAPATSQQVSAPASKVKCVAWDLDNTLWKGVLVEDGADGIELREGVPELVRALDDRGILNTIISKNDFSEAWAKVESTGLAEFFVVPAINWEPKSDNLRSTAERLNIGLDTFALVDDSAFERAEVANRYPQVRVFSEDDMYGLLERPEFDVAVSDESRRRRLSYVAEEQREAVLAASSGGYLEFLESCEMQVDVFEPTENHERRRCLELIQRSNQLNLSTRRYSEAEFTELLEDPSKLSFAWRCRDRFGDYGIVGFGSVSFAQQGPIVRDLVISCRVAKKKVENGVFAWLAASLRDSGYATLRASYRPSDRNHVLLAALEDVGFSGAGSRDDTDVILVLGLGDPVAHGEIVTVTCTHPIEVPTPVEVSRSSDSASQAG